MSRLQAPGFSRLRAPGFTRPVVPTQPQASIPQQAQTGDHVFKRPHDIPPRPKVQPIQRLPQPRSQLTRMRMPTKAAYGVSPQLQPAQHGPSPYDRSKPPTSQIPYVGKKRTIGSLKAPESRLTKPSPNQQIPKPQSITPRTVPANSNASSTSQTAPQSQTEPKPTRRQLIPAGPKPPTKLTRPKSYVQTNTKPSGLSQPRPVSARRASGNDSMPNPSLSAVGRGLSRSLQNLPHQQQPKAKCREKSSSQENLLNSASKRQVNENKRNSNSSALPQGSTLQNRFGSSDIRPRVSTQNNALNNTVNISTPCHKVDTANKQHLKTLKISPIANSDNENMNATFNVSQTVNYEACLNETRVIDNVSVFEPPNVNQALNMTYSAEVALNNTEIIQDEGKEICNKSIESHSRSYDNTKKENLSTSATENVNTFETGNLDTSKTEKNETLNELSLSDELASVLTPDKEDYENPNKTKIIKCTEETEFTESDFLENQCMPEHLGVETPLKTTTSHTFSDGFDLSFSDDIQKVIEAISSGTETLENNVTTTSTSPIKHSENLDLNNENKPIMTTIASDTANNNTQLMKDLEDSAKSELDFREDHFSPDVEEISKYIKPDTLIDSTDKKKIIIQKTDNIDIPTTSVDNKQATPQDSYDEGLNIGARCNTISMGYLSRGNNELRHGKLVRRNTYGSREFGSFRAPKEMNLTETLEGNILMDNTTFLHFSNDVKAMKTQLLKLKRALLETDCPSPLMKTPLKRSNSAGVRCEMAATPPLSPRACISSPMAVVDPLVLTDIVSSNTSIPPEEEKVTATETKDEDLTSISNENNEETEHEIFEENIILKEEVGYLSEKLQKLLEHVGENEDVDKFLSSGSSYMEEFDHHDQTSRKVVLQRLYSNE